MSIRSNTVFKMTGGLEIATMYRADDGHVEGHGRKLANFLKGISPWRDWGDWALRGMNRVAAQVVAHFETTFGETYLMPARERIPFNSPIEYTLQATGGPEGRLIIEVKNSGNVVFEGTADKMLRWLDLIDQGFIAEDHAVLRVTTPSDAIDFYDKFPYLLDAEDRLGQGIRHGKEMAESIQVFSTYGGAVQEECHIIVCVGENDDLLERIDQARRFALVPSVYQVKTIVFWAKKWNDSTWNMYKNSFASYVTNIILKRVGDDPVDLISGKPLESRSDRTDEYIKLQGGGCDVP